MRKIAMPYIPDLGGANFMLQWLQKLLLRDQTALSPASACGAEGERLAAEYRLFQPPVLFEAENCESPVVFGAVRTLIVLPSALMPLSGVDVSRTGWAVP